MKIFAERLITAGGEIDNALITVTDGSITEISTGIAKDSDFQGKIVVPGFVDIHCHGGIGHHFFDRNEVSAREAATFHLQHGSTSVIASFIAAPIDELIEQIRFLVQELPLLNIVGIHLEGPYLSEIFCGAHNPKFLSAPQLNDVKNLLDVGRGWIKMVTLAPELDGALDTISYLSKNGVIAAIGHSDADDVVTKKAIDHGARVVTHFFSAMRPIHHRIPGMTLTSLFDDRIFLELILDNVHIATNAIAIPLHFASDRILGITDALSVAGMPDGDYELGTTKVELRNKVAMIKGQNLLAGSTLTMDRSFKNSINSLGLTPQQAVHAFSVRPSQIFGLDSVGDIKVGKDANILLLDEDFTLEKVFFKGVLQ